MTNRKMEDLNDNLKQKLDDIEQWKQRLARQEAETNKYRTYEVELRNYQQKNEGLGNEIERLNNVIKTRLSDVEEWKNKARQLEAAVNNFGVMEKNFRELQEKMQDQIRGS